MSSISREQVAHLAMLARIELSETELERMSGELAVILDAVAAVGEVVSADVPAMSHPVPLVNVMRADVVHPGLSHEAALAAAPQVQDDSFAVPRILGDEQ
ncbi:aspartyl-tRNA(Asn)/glutamyl-tRNA(Gln) amidotransferase subunit C [Kineosphaera limosa]|uniref:Aspartyl/glutamyl-tRNA(Asn/Gln) amidotransferase subunit C n=1 Tax=Kineosphaera limosa NBRC 100340 TaxID=1184609 RepID=K6XA60_9MICO|nr:Asp-tRNA(Asn)/Glu-tRNA(Gln) amidotransferase subunit GatC [Kineosphaera limosa]NYD99529.1 aspartyl-tRNA(Asn)/glutamyl-tRNA(Gln) amidotransferase subunit C [Kineosphaera limosa]GAB95714.1 aspartyl/glutamyl-tRNA(Asn/Gln) amidotransferase subunit C [Kineosphaera limosa NBRC 100340]